MLENETTDAKLQVEIKVKTAVNQSAYLQGAPKKTFLMNFEIDWVIFSNNVFEF